MFLLLRYMLTLVRVAISNMVIPSTTEWDLPVLTIEMHANSPSRCDFDMLMPPELEKEIAHVATEIQVRLQGPYEF
jgi:hypothetical protein